MNPTSRLRALARNGPVYGKNDTKFPPRTATVAAASRETVRTCELLPSTEGRPARLTTDVSTTTMRERWLTYAGTQHHPPTRPDLVRAEHYPSRVIH